MKQEIIRINLEGVNCYLAKTEVGFLLFDTGGHITMDKVFNNRRDALIEQLEQAGCMPGNLKAVILTHGDNDHVANAAFLREKYHTVIAMHCDDIDLVENLTLEKMMESFRFKSIALKAVSLLLQKTILKIATKTLEDFVSFTPDILLKDGDSLSPYGLAAKVIHLPGHTAGSIGILTEDGQLICGDTFANMRKPGAAPNAYDFKQMNNSISKLKAMNIRRIYPGHGEPFEVAQI